MVVGDLHIFRTLRRPNKANPPLIIDADTVLPSSVAFKRLKSVAWWHPHEVQRGSGIELRELAACDCLDVRKSRYAASVMKGFRVATFEGSDGHLYYRISKYDMAQVLPSRGQELIDEALRYSGS